MKRILFLLTILAVLIVILIISSVVPYLPNYQTQEKVTLQVKSIDTVKYSRDLALQMLEKPEFDAVINMQMDLISKTGANYVAISTPYDPQFLPFLIRWVNFARKNNLKVWFRGNFAGWEGWFGYPKIDRSTHLKMVNQFILSNSTLFQDGDIFTPCPECENGGPGDPRDTKDIAGFREFMISEYQASKQDFAKINKKVISNYASMNYDVATLVMDIYTTSRMDGVVTIDHYIANPEQLAKDVDALAILTKGAVVLGEYGVPIPDIHGNLSDDQQSAWLDTALATLVQSSNILGMNYWTNMGGSTALWDDAGQPKKAVFIIQKYYSSATP